MYEALDLILTIAFVIVAGFSIFKIIKHIF